MVRKNLYQRERSARNVRFNYLINRRSSLKCLTSSAVQILLSTRITSKNLVMIWTQMTFPPVTRYPKSSHPRKRPIMRTRLKTWVAFLSMILRPESSEISGWKSTTKQTLLKLPQTTFCSVRSTMTRLQKVSSAKCPGNETFTTTRRSSFITAFSAPTSPRGSSRQKSEANLKCQTCTTA